VVEAVSSYDEAKMRDKLTDGKELTHESKKYYKCKSGGLYVHFASSSLFVMGPEAGVKKALSTSANRKSGPLDEGLSMLSSGRQLVKASKYNTGGGIKFGNLEAPQSDAAYVSLSGNTVTEYQVYVYEDTAKATAAKAAMDEMAQKFAQMGKEMAEKMGAKGGKKRGDGSVSQSGNKIYVKRWVELDPDEAGFGLMGFGGGFGF
jgi:hypothetical protein